MNAFVPVFLSALLAFAPALSAQGRDGEFPVPSTVSPQLQSMIAAGIPEGWDKPPRTVQE